MSLARRGEDAVASALQERGWRILARNYRWIGTEVDIIACKGQTIIGVEVKSRRRWDPRRHVMAELLPWRKRISLRLGLTAFISRNHMRHAHWRLDLALAVFAAGEKEKPMIHYEVDIGSA